MEASAPSTATRGHSHDRFQILPKCIISSPAPKQTQEWTGKAGIFMRAGTSLQSTTFNHSTKDQELCFAHLFPHHLATMALPWAKAQAAYPSATLALCHCHPLWPWQPTPTMEELTSRVASSGHRDSRPTPPKRPEKPSAVPSSSPGL